MAPVSVIIPVYNGEKYIVEALESVLSQTYRGFEIIIVDDGSTDSTPRLIEPYVKGGKIRVVRQDNSGPSRARNRGIAEAGGEYCAFLDSDDVMMPERLKLQVEKMEREDIGLVYTDLMSFNEKGTVYESKTDFIRPYSGDVLDRLLVENFITTSTVMVKKECFDKAGYFDEGMKHSEDYKMWLNIAKLYRIGYVDRPLTRYRYHEDSLSWDRVVISASSFEVVREFWEENREYREKNRRLFRASMANQLVNLAIAYNENNRKREAARCLVESFGHNPFSGKTYKTLLKMVLRP